MVEELFTGGEKEFSIELGGKNYDFALKELTWLESNKILSMSVKVSGKGLEIQLDVWYEEYLLAALTKSPWPLNETRMALRKLNPRVGALLEMHIPKPGALESNIDFLGSE